MIVIKVIQVIIFRRHLPHEALIRLLLLPLLGSLFLLLLLGNLFHSVALWLLLMVCGSRWSVKEAHTFTVVDVGAGRLFLIPVIVIISHNIRRAALRLIADGLGRGVATE